MIHWRRGFFRTWLLLVAFWIPASIWIYTDIWSSARYREGDIAENPTTKEYVVLSDGDWRPCADAETSTKDAAEKQLEPCAHVKMWARLRAAGWIFVPPISILIIGAALGWVVIGFRPTPQSK
jgi:hypothetical protein